jgi:hypothetical protein
MERFLRTLKGQYRRITGRRSFANPVITGALPKSHIASGSDIGVTGPDS